jgi:hypothetical protein
MFFKVFGCINGGSISGKTGSCSCDKCNTGWEGIHCGDDSVELRTEAAKTDTNEADVLKSIRTLKDIANVDADRKGLRAVEALYVVAEHLGARGGNNATTLARDLRGMKQAILQLETLTAKYDVQNTTCDSCYHNIGVLALEKLGALGKVPKPDAVGAQI